jgi:hypothetical protein
LQLSLENEKLTQARAAYRLALQTRGEADDDIVGYVFAVNGRISSADVYPSNALFRKMWPKQLAAGITEAIGAGSTKPAAAPSVDAVADFIASAEKAAPHEENVNALLHREVRDADKSLFVEARSADGAWVHRSYLAK